MEKQTHSQKPQSALAAGHRLQTESDMCQSHLDRPLDTRLMDNAVLKITDNKFVSGGIWDRKQTKTKY